MRTDQLGVQAHCLRSEIAADLDGTLATVAGLGIGALEMMSFPACRGNWWGDFGVAADLRPSIIANRIRASGLQCPSVMVLEKELTAERLPQTLDWVLELGAPRLVLTSFTVASTRTLADWSEALARVDELAQQVNAAGLEFVLHTQPDLWTAGSGGLEVLRRWLDQHHCPVEFDPTGAIIHGTDPAEFVKQFAETLYAVHLRDGATPPEPTFYLAAEALGDGGVRWREVFRALDSSAVRWYILEMETTERSQVFPAIRRSLAYLQTQGLLSKP